MIVDTTQTKIERQLQPPIRVIVVALNDISELAAAFQHIEMRGLTARFVYLHPDTIQAWSQDGTDMENIKTARVMADETLHRREALVSS